MFGGYGYLIWTENVTAPDTAWASGWGGQRIGWNYRNDRMFEALKQACGPETRLCIARDLTTADEWIVTRRIADWKKTPAPDLAKRPTVFLLLAG